jgi:serine/threonine protein phosphatase 1
MNSGYTPKIWTSQGGFNTIKSYIPTIENVPQVILDSTEVPESHIQFFKNSKLYLEEEIEGKICVFVHGGYDYTKRIEETELNDLLWDRELFSKALEKQKIAIRQNNDPNNFDFYDEIYIGHTTTTWISQDRKNHFYGIDGTYPVKMCNVWAMDQGAGWEGYLTMMDILTKEVYRSDKVSKLYPEEKGRD